MDPFFHLVHNLYSAMWSNMWAPSVWTMFGFIIADIRNIRRNRATKDLHHEKLSALAGQIEALSDRLKSSIGGKDDDSQ